MTALGEQASRAVEAIGSPDSDLRFRHLESWCAWLEEQVLRLREGAPEKLVDIRSNRDSAIAVSAHGMLNSLAVLMAAAGTLGDSWTDLDHDRRASLLRMIEEQGQLIAMGLGDMVRGHTTAPASA